ncbi:hypothetical protein [Streptomyces sp. C10-9-1]|uniref:hypothetical protein n=1 Tax=Streptomyces sp. C10-9-1 TaxID=1859285 RepID=UPI003F4A44CF
MAIPGNLLSDTTSTVDPNTSGWAPLLNCVLSKGTNGTATDGCLAVSSITSGEMRARTAASVAVVPGVEYATFADASGATVPERIGIRWLTAASAEISISWSLTVSSAAASWHRIAVADYAPEGAAYAQVVLSSTPAASSVVSYYDNVYLGPPIKTVGNLLTAAAETSERASDWPFATEANCSVSRTLPPVGWSAAAYSAGGHAATMTVSSNGDASFVITEAPVVTPGTEYIAYAYLNPPTSMATAWIELRFYDETDSELQVTRGVLDAPGTGWYRQRVSDFAPATAAYATVAFGLDGATAAQVLRVDRIALLARMPTREGDIVAYTDASYEQGVGSWTVVSGAATLARSSPWGTDGLDGSYCLEVSSATATTSVIRSARYPLGTVAPELDWTMEVGLKVAAGSWDIVRSIRWYDDEDTDLGDSSSVLAAVPTPGWWLFFGADGAPEGATQAAVEYTVTATSTSSVLRLDRVAMWPTVPLTEVIVNAGTASTTVKLRELPSNPISVWRVTRDGTRTLVRGATGLIDRQTLTSSVLIIEDYEAPLGVEVHYRSESRNSSGVVTAIRVTDWATVPQPDRNFAWLKSPGSPQRNMQVLVSLAPDWTRPIPQTEHRVRGRRNAVVHSDVRGGQEGELVVWTRSDDERTRLNWLLDSGRVLLWQAAPGMGVEDTYVNVGQTTEGRTSRWAGEVWREWKLPLKQADMPVSLGVVGSAGRTWQDVLTENATWQRVLERYATWEDVFLNRPIGG